MKKVFIYGACSAIATDLARKFAEAGDELLLAARNAEKLSALADDFEVRYGKRPHTMIHDAIEIDNIPEMFDEAEKISDGIDIFVSAHGVLPDQERAEKDMKYLHEVTMINGNSAVYWCHAAAEKMKSKYAGTIVAISSVAGDRGRYSNYVYGASKGFLSTFLQGLTNKMAHCGVNVITVKPGFVDTPMTAHLEKNFLFASSERVARDIFKAIKKSKRGVIYSKPIWKLVMLAVIHTPGFIFNKMKM